MICKKCKSDASKFILKVSTFWKDADVVCICGQIIDSIYCTHCLEGGKKRYNEYRAVCSSQVTY